MQQLKTAVSSLPWPPRPLALPGALYILLECWVRPRISQIAAIRRCFLTRELFLCLDNSVSYLRAPPPTHMPLPLNSMWWEHKCVLFFFFISRLPFQPRASDTCHLLSCDKRWECICGWTTASLYCQPPQGAITTSIFPLTFFCFSRNLFTEQKNTAWPRGALVGTPST